MLFLPKAIPYEACKLAKEAVISKNMDDFIEHEDLSLAESIGVVQENGRKIFYNPDDPKLIEFSRIVDKIVQEHMYNADIEYLGPAYPYDAFWVYYPESSGMPLHQDVLEDDDRGLVIAALTYIADSSDFEGGEINFPDYDISVKPEAGDLFIYDPLDYHSVDAITKGFRIAYAMCYVDKEENVIYNVYN
jgi:hypothetical protein